jgi:hypothetical protein
MLHKLVTAPILRFFDPELPTLMFTDASEYAVGGWIAQEHPDGIHPVLYWSRKLKDAETHYPTHERELLAIVKMLKRNRSYLLGHPVICKTDHAALTHLQTQPNLSPRQVRWVEQLQEYDLIIEYIPGSLNSLADLLSRQPHYQPRCANCKANIHQSTPDDNHPTIQTQTVLDTDSTNSINLDPQSLIQYYTADPLVQILIKQGRKHFHRIDNVWFYGHQLYIPQVPSLRLQILQLHHDLPRAGHQGATRTLEKITRYFYWPTIRQDTTKFTNSCDLCQRIKPSHNHKAGLLLPQPISASRVAVVSMDTAEMPTSTSGNDSFTCIVDTVTKLCKLYAHKKSYAAPDHALAFMQRWHDAGLGLPEQIITDRDTRFMSKFTQSLWKLLKIKHTPSTARHQQTDGQSEVYIRTIKYALQAFPDYNMTTWDSRLSCIEFALNDSLSSSTGFTPFFLAYGTHPRTVISNTLAIPSKFKTTDVASVIQTNLQQARLSIAKYQDLMITTANKSRSLHRKYAIGDLVLLKRSGINYPADSTSSLKGLKSKIGPFKIVSVPDAHGLNYKLELPATMKIHPVFHSEHLEPYVHPNTHFASRSNDIHPVDNSIPDDQVFEEEAYLSHKRIRNKLHWLIKWKGYNESHNSWEPATKDDLLCIKSDKLDDKGRKVFLVEWKHLQHQSYEFPSNIPNQEMLQLYLQRAKSRSRRNSRGGVKE